MSKFKLGILIVFGSFIAIGIIVFASSKNSNNELSGNLIMWGTINSNTVNDFLSSFKFDEKQNITVTYIQKNTDSFSVELAESIADGKNPDILLLPLEQTLKEKNRIFVIPYKNYSERIFKDSFIEQSELFLTKNGIMALPIILDPLVMYWNRDIFSAKLKTNPPLYWDQFQVLAPEFALKDNSGNIKESLVSFGEWKNVSNAKDILVNLFIQAGNDIIVTKPGLSTDLLSNKDKSFQPASYVINFYTQFSNPVEKTYSWNRSLPKSVDMFLAGNLATYIGFASELQQIRAKNPNLNFDIAMIPQIKGENKNKVFARIYGLSILKNSKLIPQSFQAVNIMTDVDRLKIIEDITNLPPVRRDMLSRIPSDSYKEIFYKSAIWSKGFLDVDSKETNSIFGSMIESITSGRSSISEAIYESDESLNQLLRRYEKN